MEQELKLEQELDQDAEGRNAGGFFSPRRSVMALRINNKASRGSRPPVISIRELARFDLRGHSYGRGAGAGAHSALGCSALGPALSACARPG